VSALLNNLKPNSDVYSAMSTIDKTTLSEYNIRYCSYKAGTVYVIVVSEAIDSTMGSRWSRAKVHCRDRGVHLDVSIVTQEQYSKWVYHNIRKDPNSAEEWLQRWYKVIDKEPQSGMWSKAADNIYYLKNISDYTAIAPKILESGYLSMR
jgi:hypothetical protein